MNCSEAGTPVEGYADGEIDGFRGKCVERHLRGCPACAVKHRRMLRLRARICAEVPYLPAPPALRTRVQALLANTRDMARLRPRPERNHWRWLTAGALAGCAATVLSWVVATAVIDWRANEGVAVEAVAVHVRATLNSHLVEIASSDRHTVKPWLSARLDYSPPVQDLAGEGFALAGGRLDMLDKQQIATLVYLYHQHTIDVFVRTGSVHAPSALRTVRGFNVTHAAGSGMDWLVVSDVSADVLATFVQRLARGDNS